MEIAEKLTDTLLTRRGWAQEGDGPWWVHEPTGLRLWPSESNVMVVMPPYKGRMSLDRQVAMLAGLERAFDPGVIGHRASDPEKKLAGR